MLTLKQGDTIGIVSPSAPIAGFCPKRLERGVKMLESMGFVVKLGEHVSAITNFTAGTAIQRASDINNMFADPQVKAIMATIGGYSANDVLEKLNYDLIAKNPKPFIGYSDITVMHGALSRLANIKCLLGPMVLPQFGEYPEIQNFTKESFVKVLSKIGTGERYVLPSSENWTEEMLLWDKEDVRARNFTSNTGWQIINSGTAQGKLVAGNLNTMSKLFGTKYMFDLDDSILFLEDDEEESIATIQRMLTHMKQANYLEKVRGLVFGRFQNKSGVTSENLKNILTTVFNNLTIPVIMGVDFGHTDPMLTLPIGNSVEMNTEKRELAVVL